jgi:hypothetical protein
MIQTTVALSSDESAQPESWIMQNTIDCETILKSLIFMADGVATTIGENGARATMRLAGHRAAVNLLEALPLQLQVADAIKRAGPVMAELGFVSDIAPLDDRRLAVSGNVILKTMQALGIEPKRHPACYYTIGLFEGFVHVLSKTHISIVHHEIRDGAEIWTLAE